MVRIYYAGLDNYSLPFSEGNKLQGCWANNQIDYIKLLCLVSDHVIIPPSFFPYWIGTKKAPNNLSQLYELYQAGFVSSAVHSTMNMSKDFLEHKLIFGTEEDKFNIKNNQQKLNLLFSEIPLSKRNVINQSKGFKERMIEDININAKNSYYKDLLINNLIEQKQKGGVLASRENINQHHHYALNRGDINKTEFRKYYYTTNKNYYHQGAMTYNSIISTLDAYRYTILGKSIFENDNGLYLAYDPQIIMMILNNFGISNTIVQELNINELTMIKQSQIFHKFKQQYFEFAKSLQLLNLQLSNFSKERLYKMNSYFQKEFNKSYFNQQTHYNKMTKRIDHVITTVFSFAFGLAGFVIDPLLSMLFGFIPLILSASGIINLLSDYIIERFDSSEMTFYKFIEEIKKCTARIKNDEIFISK